MANDFRVVY